MPTMVSPNDVQAAIVSELQAYGPLIALLPDGAEGVRESQWKGVDFQYPCVRVERAAMASWGNGNCANTTSRIIVTITAASKKDSSSRAQEIQGHIVAALDGHRIETTDVIVHFLRPQNVIPSTPRAEDDVWQGPVLFTGIVTAA